MELPIIFQALGGSKGQDRLSPCPHGDSLVLHCPIDFSVMTGHLAAGGDVQGGDGGDREMGTSGPWEHTGLALEQCWLGKASCTNQS